SKSGRRVGPGESLLAAAGCAGRFCLACLALAQSRRTLDWRLLSHDAGGYPADRGGAAWAGNQSGLGGHAKEEPTNIAKIEQHQERALPADELGAAYARHQHDEQR